MIETQLKFLEGHDNNIFWKENQCGATVSNMEN
jgi:hypothetical protein